MRKPSRGVALDDDDDMGLMEVTMRPDQIRDFGERLADVFDEPVAGSLGVVKKRMTVQQGRELALVIADMIETALGKGG